MLGDYHILSYMDCVYKIACLVTLIGPQFVHEEKFSL